MVGTIDTHKGTRCPGCYWALYDGVFCQNPSCKYYGKDIPEPIFLTNQEAFSMINAKEAKSQS